MTVHYRRSDLSRADEVGAVAVSLLIGLGAAATTYYVTRLMLSKERLSGEPGTPANDPSGGRRSLPGGRTADAEG